jgi:hypothetical protein
MSNERHLQRQGDVLIVPVNSVPEEAKVDEGNPVLVEGEVTGHAHRIRQSDLNAKKAFLMMVGTQMYLRALEQIHIDHEDHGTNILPPGDYEIRRQQEFTPQGWRRVAD